MNPFRFGDRVRLAEPSTPVEGIVLNPLVPSAVPGGSPWVEVLCGEFVVVATPAMLVPC